MHLEDYKIYNKNILAGLIAQRLVGKLCSHCKMDYSKAKETKALNRLLHERIENMRTISPAEMRDNPLYFVNPTGCTHCNHTGYAGMQAIPEVVIPDDKLMDLLRENKNQEAHTYWLTNMEGIDLLGMAWLLALKGIISPADVESEVMVLTPEPCHEIALENWKNAEDEVFEMYF